MDDTRSGAALMIESVCAPGSVRRAYDLWSYIYGAVAAPLEHGPRLRALEAAAIQPHDQVLEAAVGPGHIFLEILRRVDRRRLVCGIDLSRNMLARAQQLARTAGYTNASLLQADARQLPCREQAFDVLYSSYMLDILPIQDVRTTLLEFRRVLKPGARLVLVNLSKASPGTRIWIERLYQSLPAAWVPYLLGGCRPVLLADSVRQAGFRSVEREYVDALMPSEIVCARL